MIALSKCDGFERIFFNAGTKPAELAECTALTVANRRKWDVARVVIYGEIGKYISDTTENPRLEKAA